MSIHCNQYQYRLYDGIDKWKKKQKKKMLPQLDEKFNNNNNNSEKMFTD